MWILGSLFDDNDELAHIVDSATKHRDAALRARHDIEKDSELVESESESESTTASKAV